MKKILLAVCFFLTCAFTLSGENYKIKKAEITTSGKFRFTTTRPHAVEIKYPIDRNTIFTEEELLSYLDYYKQQLNNTRLFEEVSVTYETLLSNETEESSNGLCEVIVKVDLKDSNHFLAVPYPKFKSDKEKTEIKLKLKAKDDNFLGTMNPLATEINIEFTKDNDKGKFKPGFNISYDFPFSLGPVNITWVNDYSINAYLGKLYPEWNAKTGLKFELPYKHFSIVLEGYHNFINNYDYESFNDSMYSKEQFILSTPFKLYEFENFTYLIYTPSVDYSFIWDNDGIHIDNESLSGPIITLSHSLSNSKINWTDNYREGYSISLTNSWAYNFQRNDWNPSVAFEAKLFSVFPIEERDYLNKLGITADLYAFTYFDLPGQFYDHSKNGYGDKIGKRLRGIPDDSYLGNGTPNYTTSTAVVLNLDFPIYLFETSFKKDIINFAMQLSPFIDAAVFRDRKLPLQTDSKLCCGMEVLVFPKKWSSFIIRASVGFDIKTSVATATDIKGLVKDFWANKEISIGLGLHY